MVRVSPEALVLALSTVIRPTSAAAVFAMLAAARPARLLLAYIIAGFAFSAGIGVVVVILLSGWTGPEAQDEVRAVIGIVLGAVSLGYAAGLLSGRVQQPGGDADDTTTSLPTRAPGSAVSWPTCPCHVRPSWVSSPICPGSSTSRH